MIEPFVRQIFYKNDVIEPKKYMTEGRPETAPLMTLAHIGGFGKCLEIFYNSIYLKMPRNACEFRHASKIHENSQKSG